jgi:chitinase
VEWLDERRVFCCNPPDDTELFTPVPLEYLFRDPPPVTDPVKWDLQILGGYVGSGEQGAMISNNPTADPNYGAFGFVLISGPKDVVSTFSKRDNSHIEILDCESIVSEEKQSLRFVCTNENDNSNCDDILDGGLEGTVIRMPENCGPGSYIVAHSMKISEDQSIPHHLFKRLVPTREVMDLEFSYDFKLMKRSDEKVQFRVDYSNIAGYWETVVDAPGEKRKRSSLPPQMSQRDLIDKRFFSGDVASWGDKFDDLDEQAFFVNLTEPATEVIIDEKLKKCDGEEYLQVQSDGTCTAYAKFGFTIIGTLQPFNIDDAFGLVDFKYDLAATVSVKGNAGVDTEYKTTPAHIIPNSEAAFSHPGIVSFKPSFDLQIGIKATDASFSGSVKGQLCHCLGSSQCLKANLPP